MARFFPTGKNGGPLVYGWRRGDGSGTVVEEGGPIRVRMDAKEFKWEEI